MERKAAAVSLSAKATLKVRSAILIFISSEVKSVSSSLSSAGVVVTVSPSCSIGSSEQETQPGTTPNSRMGNQKRNVFIVFDWKRFCIGSRCYALCPTTRKATASCSFLAPLRPTNKHGFICQVGSPSHTRRPLRPRPPNTWGFIHSAKLSTPTLHFFYTHYSNHNPNYRTSQALQPVFPKTSPGFFQTPEPKARTSPRLTTAHLRRVLVRRRHPRGHHRTYLPEPPAACSAPYSPIFSNFNW